MTDPPNLPATLSEIWRNPRNRRNVRESFSTSREAIPNLSQCVRVGTDLDAGSFALSKDVAADGRVALISLKKSAGLRVARSRGKGSGHVAASSCKSRGILRATSFGQHCAQSSQTSQSRSLTTCAPLGWALEGPGGQLLPTDDVVIKATGNCMAVSPAFPAFVTRVVIAKSLLINRLTARR